jgi:hypothetical protein
MCGSPGCTLKVGSLSNGIELLFPNLGTLWVPQGKQTSLRTGVKQATHKRPPVKAASISILSALSGSFVHGLGCDEFDALGESLLDLLYEAG